MSKKIGFVKQLDSNDCGLACLAMLLGYFGHKITLNQLKANAEITIDGISIENLMRQGNIAGLELIPINVEAEALNASLAVPFIAYWEQSHFVIVEKITTRHIHIIDPAFGRYKMSVGEFLNGWKIVTPAGDAAMAGKGVLLLVSPLDHIGDNITEPTENRKMGWSFIQENFFRYRTDNLRIFGSLFVVSLLQFLLPFANQFIVDYGIANRDIGFIYQVSVMLVVLYLLIAFNEMLRSWTLMYLSTRINFNLISRFLYKITALPIKTIYSRRIGDYIERINDHKRLEEFFSESIIKSLFSIFSIVVYGTVLAIFDYQLLLLVAFFTVAELTWIYRFLGKVKTLDNKIFSLNAQDQDKVYEILSNLPDIKLNNIEHDKNVEWQSIQQKLFVNYLKRIRINQVEQVGSRVLHAFQLFGITIISAVFVVNGQITIGTMFSVLFIVNQLNVPLTHLINFSNNFQLVSNSFQRIYEIHHLEEEQTDGTEPDKDLSYDINVTNLSFSYIGKRKVLEDINFTIPANKVTAIVGYSGSGKTTILKLLLKFYENYSGQISLGESIPDLRMVKGAAWREGCGAVLQESSIYSETIAYNVTLQESARIDKERLQNALELACLKDFTDSLPLGVFTKLNAGGATLSSGQKQRLLIARLIYKRPAYVFLDEATNSLDANTENMILRNLYDFLNNRTVVVVAHRLSTVKNADQIIVLDQGKVVETGNHLSLIGRKGVYYHLIKNQLELEYEQVT